MPDRSYAVETMHAPTLNRAAQRGRPTEDEILLVAPQPEETRVTQADTWRVLRIRSDNVADPFARGVKEFLHGSHRRKAVGRRRIRRLLPTCIAERGSMNLLLDGHAA